MYHVLVVVPGANVCQLTFANQAAAKATVDMLYSQGLKSWIIEDIQTESKPQK